MEKIRKIPIERLLDVLHEIYHAGVDFIDIYKGDSSEDGEDTISISYTKDYINPEHYEEFNKYYEELINESEKESESNIEIKFSDEDLNDLI